jgi:hypothetical protein
LKFILLGEEIRENDQHSNTIKMIKIYPWACLITLIALSSTSSGAMQADAPTSEARFCLIKAFQSGQLQDRKELSQVGEDGIMEVMHRCIGREFNGTYAEFGTESCSECTTRYLREKKGWTGLLLDGGHDNSSINLHREMIFADNIVSLFQKYKVPPFLDHLTVDLDLNTFYPMQALLAAGYRPRTITVEINRNFDSPLSQSYVTLSLPSSRCDFRNMWDNWGQQRDPVVRMNCYFGASPMALTRLAQFFGYLPMAFDEAAVNMYFIHSSEVGGLRPPSQPSQPPLPSQETGDAIDEDFNLEKAIKALGDKSHLGKSIHHPCHNNAWYKVPSGVNFSSPDWMGQLEVVVLGMGGNDVGRTFTEQKLVMVGSKKP